MPRRGRWLMAAVLVWCCAAFLSSARAQDAGPTTPLSVTLETRPAEQTPLGSPVEVKYTWTVGTGRPLPAPGARVFVAFIDGRGQTLFEDDHLPEPAPHEWRPGQTHTYERTVFIPVVPYIGPVRAAVSLGLGGKDDVLVNPRAATLELTPQTGNIFLVYKEGWHQMEMAPDRPDQEIVWTMKDAVASFKNPKKDVVIYLEADTDTAALRQAVVTLSIGGKTIHTVSITQPASFLARVEVDAATLGSSEWVDLHLAMNRTFTRSGAEGPRELGLRVHHLYVGEAARFKTAGRPWGLGGEAAKRR